MADIILTKGANSITLRPRFPHDENYQGRQSIGMSRGGKAKVADHGAEEHQWTYSVPRITAAAKSDILTFIRTYVNYHVETFTLTDQDSNTFTVRFWTIGRFRLVRGTGRWEWDFTLREEV